VKRVLSPTTVELTLPTGWGIHPVINTEALKKFLRREMTADPPPPIQDELGRDHYLVDRVTGRRTRRGRKEYRIKWQGYDDETWEPESFIGKSFIDEYQGTLPTQRPKRGGGRVV
jgi:hypothetical protein